MKWQKVHRTLCCGFTTCSSRQSSFVLLWTAFLLRLRSNSDVIMLKSMPIAHPCLTQIQQGSSSSKKRKSAGMSNSKKNLNTRHHLNACDGAVIFSNLHPKNSLYGIMHHCQPVFVHVVSFLGTCNPEAHHPPDMEQWVKEVTDKHACTHTDMQY